jgi:glucokinase
MSDVVLGVDVGGTTIAAGVVTRDGDVLAEAQAPTHAGGAGSAGRTIEALIEALQSDVAGRGLAVTGIGVGVPGIVDAEQGTIGDEVPHVPELTGTPLAATLAARFRRPVFIDNDVNALALAEWEFGAGRGARSLVVLAPGTGFGSGIVVDGRLLRGAAGFAGELGHAPVKFDGDPCWCGGRGCLALFASGRGIAEAARSRVARAPGAALLEAAGGDPLAITAPLVFRMAEAGDAEAACVVDEACQAIGAMIGVVVNGLNPDVVVITGGVAGSLVPLERKLLRAAGEYALRRALARTRVVIVPADKRVTMRGAAALVFYELARAGRGTA